METVIYYFSGTGNSLKVALELGKQLGKCEVLPIAKCMKNGDLKVNNKKVGFVFPLYYLGLPKMVAEFIRNADLSQAEYIFTVITRGWPLVGGAIKQIKTFMKTKGQKLDFGAYIHMPMNDFTLAKVANEKSQEKIFGEFSKNLDKVAAKIRENRKGYQFEPISFMLNARNTPFINKVNTLDRLYSVNSLCTGCAICEKICPADNIHMKDGIPHWNGKCQMCLACFHYCPNKAISYKNNCENILRYHHPDISAKQIMEQK